MTKKAPKTKAKNRGWPAGRPRLEGGLTTKRMTVSLSERDEGLVAALMKRWGMRNKGNAIRRAILLAAGAIGEPLQSACPTCSNWDWETGACTAITPEVKAWSEDPRGTRSPDVPGMIEEHPESCPGWR